MVVVVFVIMAGVVFVVVFVIMAGVVFVAVVAS